MKKGRLLSGMILLIGFILFSGNALAASGCTTLYDGTWKGVIADSGVLEIIDWTDGEMKTTHNPFTAQYDFEMSIRCANSADNPEYGGKGWWYEVTHVKASHPFFNCASGCTPVPWGLYDAGGSDVYISQNGLGRMYVEFPNRAIISTALDYGRLKASPDGKRIELYIPGGMFDYDSIGWSTERADGYRDSIETDNCIRLGGRERGSCWVISQNKNTIILTKISGEVIGGTGQPPAAGTQPGTGQAQPPAQPAAPQHPLQDFGSDFQPSQLSQEELDALATGFDSYNSGCKGKENTPACKKKAEEVFSSANSALQLDHIAKADDPKAVQAWQTAQTATLSRLEALKMIEQLVALGLNIDTNLAFLPVLMEIELLKKQQQLSKEEIQSIISQATKDTLDLWKLSEKNKASDHTREDFEKFFEMQKRGDIEGSSLYKQASSELGNAVHELGAAGAEAFRFTKALTLMEKESASQIYYNFMGKLSEKAGSEPSN